jgi:hypothetical protein
VAITEDARAPHGGHESPSCGPNLLSELGVRADDDERTERLLDQILERQDDAGRFLSLGPVSGAKAPVWGAVACDSHAVTEVLVCFGRTDHPRVQQGLDQMASTLSTTPQGAGWRCTPHTVTGWRGPGREADVCPQVTLEALRAFARLPSDQRPDGLLDAVRTSLAVWRQRTIEHPYMFGHGVTEFSFGTKKQSSPTATAMTAAVARRFTDLAANIQGIDVLKLASTRGDRQPVGPCL